MGLSEFSDIPRLLFRGVPTNAIAILERTPAALGAMVSGLPAAGIDATKGPVPGYLAVMDR